MGQLTFDAFSVSSTGRYGKHKLILKEYVLLVQLVNRTTGQDTATLNVLVLFTYRLVKHNINTKCITIVILI